MNGTGANKTARRGEPRVVEYYSGLSQKYKRAKYFSIAVTVFFILFMIAFYRSEITVENLKYLIKYLDISETAYSERGLRNYKTIYYDAAGEMRTGLYKNDLAVVKSSSVDLYNMLGNNILSYSVYYTMPVLEISDKYMLVYSIGENSYSINNTFSELFGETFDYPISNAAVCDTGLYAIVSKTLEYKSAVFVYDGSFKRVSQILKDKTVVDIDLKRDGSRLAIASVYLSDGSFDTEIMTLNPTSGEADSVKTFVDTFAVKTGFHADGGYTLVCDNKAMFFGSDDKLLKTVAFGGSIPVNCLINENYTVLVFNENVVGNNNEVKIFDPRGELVFSGALDGKIVDVKSDGVYAYILMTASISRIRVSDGKASGSLIESGKLESGCVGLVLKDETALLVCYTGRAEPFSIETLFGGAASGEAGADDAEAGGGNPAATAITPTKTPVTTKTNSTPGGE